MSKPIALSEMVRADHRFLMNLVDTFYKKKGYRATPKAFEKINKVFSQMGGTWENVFKGSPKDIDLLKKVLKVAAKVGVLEKTPKFR